jgi:Phosphatidylinositol 3- and 4-kinase/Ubiquitin family
MYLSTRVESERKLRKYKLALKVAGLEKEVTIFDWSTVGELKHEISKMLGIQVSQQKVFFGNIELNNSRMLDDYNIFSPSSRVKSLHVQLTNQTGSYIRPCPGCDYFSQDLINQVQQGLALGFSPMLALDGTGGTYFMKTLHKNVGAVFKPTDEEAYAPMNPKSYSGKLGEVGLRPGVLSGEAAYREVAAFLLDKKNISNVPETVLVQAQHPTFNYPFNKIYPKTGSLQRFVHNIGTVDDFSCSMFLAQEIQKIAILDIRILNMDRNEGNILVIKEDCQYKLIPIDHGLSISDNFDISDYDLCWMNWNQVKEPITQECYEFIESLDPLKDITILQEAITFRDKCLRNIRISALLLKKGAKAGLSLYNIGTLLYRKGYSDIPSPVEKIIEDAYNLYKTINKSISSRLKLEKILSDSVKPTWKRRPRAFSSTEIDFEGVLYSPQSLNSTNNTETDSYADTVLTISEVSDESEFEEFEKDIDSLPNNLNLSFSSSGLPCLDDLSHNNSEDEAFNTKLFYYIEAFMDLAIQKKVKELMSKLYLESEIPGGRIRSCSYALS